METDKRYVTIVLPHLLEEYDNIGDFIDDAKVFMNPEKALKHFMKTAGEIFSLEITD